MADSSSVEVNVITDQTDASGARQVSVVQANVSESSTVVANVVAGGVGAPGEDGADGAAGVGVPTGGTTGQVLAKTSSTDYDTQWVAQSGGGSGITRTVVVTSGTVTAGATASTDYTYLVAGAHTVTLPTAVGNTNRYTVKNDHSAAITIGTTSSQTIDGTTSIQISPEDSVDLISDGSNWRII